MKKQPFNYPKTLGIFIVIASLTAILMDHYLGTRLDYWLHDSAVIHQYRKQWNYTGIVVLDEGVPMAVGRKQSLPLFARATEQLIKQGAKGVYFDARISKQIEGKMPYALCIEVSGKVRWSKPQCRINSRQQCVVLNSEAGNAPLRMTSQAMRYFSIAPYLNAEQQLPDFLLYDWDAAFVIPDSGIVASERLVSKKGLMGKWVDMSQDHIVFKLASWVAPDKVKQLYQQNRLMDEFCDEGKRCRRIRLSRPNYELSLNKQLILPLSLLASCDDNIAQQTAVLLKNKAVILQATSPKEATDVLATPMVTALLSPRLLTPGAQYLVDELETVLNQDYPRKPNQLIRISLFIGGAIISTLLGAYYSQALLWVTGLLVFLGLSAFCFFVPIVQLWPVTATVTAYFIGAIQIVAVQLVLGFRQGYLLHQYLPKQIIELLVDLKEPESYQHKPIRAVVLMSDLAGYTTVTGILKRPELVMSLMNDYLSETSIVLQDTYKGILEAYVGDLVCYYWEYQQGEEATAYKNALCGAVELVALQKKFFSSVSQRYKEDLPSEAIAQINRIIDAGVGITAGEVVKGNLGPKTGVRKFSILGDPLNLASRIEGITRFFNTEIIIAGDFLETIAEQELSCRYLGKFQVKGREQAAKLYALGKADDERLFSDKVQAWEAWLTEIEAGVDSLLPCPSLYAKDQQSILTWKKNGLLSAEGVWQLHEK